MKKSNLVVGTGISGATVAREIAERMQEPVLVIDRRPHIGGNCFDFCNEHGVLVLRQGPHFFRTDNPRVREYVHRFAEWNHYQHRVLSKVDVPFGESISTEAGMKPSRNSEEAALALMDILCS